MELNIFISSFNDIYNFINPKSLNTQKIQKIGYLKKIEGINYKKINGNVI